MVVKTGKNHGNNRPCNSRFLQGSETYFCLLAKISINNNFQQFISKY